MFFRKKGFVCPDGPNLRCYLLARHPCSGQGERKQERGLGSRWGGGSESPGANPLTQAHCWLSPVLTHFFRLSADTRGLAGRHGNRGLLAVSWPLDGLPGAGLDSQSLD